jgi:transcription termination factor Rho
LSQTDLKWQDRQKFCNIIGVLNVEQNHVLNFENQSLFGTKKPIFRNKYIHMDPKKFESCLSVLNCMFRGLSKKKN